MNVFWSTEPARGPGATAAQAGTVWLLLALLLAPSAEAQPICLSLQAGKTVTFLPVSVGSNLRLSFLHSIYGSTVEEQFRVTPKGFQTSKLRYADSRLVEFYGHESARREDGWWVVDRAYRDVPILDLRVSPASSIRIALNGRSILLDERLESAGHLRLALIQCKEKNVVR
ncbi:MAG: DUF1850 domain-containing protein [Candidatus Binatia bacterium]